MSLVTIALSYLKLLFSLLILRTGRFVIICCRLGETGLSCVLEEVEVEDLRIFLYVTCLNSGSV